MSNCLEVARNHRLCSGAEEYELKIKNLTAILIGYEKKIMTKPLTNHPFADQIDMMNETELRKELRNVVNQNIDLKAVYEVAVKVNRKCSHITNKVNKLELSLAIAAIQQKENDD